VVKTLFIASDALLKITNISHRRFPTISKDFITYQLKRQLVHRPSSRRYAVQVGWDGSYQTRPL